MNITYLSQEVPIFHGRDLPVPGVITGYGGLIEALRLAVPVPLTL